MLLIAREIWALNTIYSISKDSDAESYFPQFIEK